MYIKCHLKIALISCDACKDTDPTAAAAESDDKSVYYCSNCDNITHKKGVLKAHPRKNIQYIMK